MRLRINGRKNVGYFFVLLLIGFFVFTPLLIAGEIDSIKEIYDTSIPTEIRRNFNEHLFVRGINIGLKRGQGVVDGGKFFGIYARKFLVIGLEANSFGGVWATVAVKGKSNEVFRLWLYNTEASVYDLRSITKISRGFDKQFVENLSVSAYDSFWL